MTKYGKIVALLNQEQVIIEIEDEYADRLVAGSELVVFALAENAALRALDIPLIYSPKGTIRIVMQQSAKIFLAARYKEGGQVERRPIAAMDFFTQEVRVGAKWSAEIDLADTLGIEFEREVKAGDAVGAI